MGSIRRTFLGVVAALSLSGPFAGPALAAGKTVGVSWRHFQEERWRIDEAGIKSVLDPAGYTYVSADAQADPQKQLTDVESLLARGCDALDHPGPGFARRSCRPIAAGQGRGHPGHRL